MAGRSFSLSRKIPTGPGRRAKLLTTLVATLGLGIGMVVAASPALAGATGTISLAPIVAYNGDNLSTIVITGTGLPIAPAADIGEETGDSQIVEVADAGTSGFFGNPSWDAGWNGDDCEVTIGASTSTEMILSVGDQGAVCDIIHNYYAQAGDSITVTLYNSDASTFGSATTTVVANPGSTPTVDSVTPPYGPQGGGTAAAPGTGTVLVETSNTTTPEAFWFGGTGLTSGFFGDATTDFTATGNPGEYAVVPPAYDYGGNPGNQGVSVYTVDQTNGMSQEDCVVEVTGCNDEYFYLSDNSGTLNTGALNYNLSDTLASASAGGSGACGAIAPAGVAASLSVGGSLTGGPIDVSANVGFSDSNSSLPEAAVAGATITLENPVVVTVSLSAQLSGCIQIPFPDLSLPDGLGGLYFVLGGSINGAVSLAVTIDKGTYSISGGYIPGSQPADLGGASVTANCVDASGNPASGGDCVTTALSASLTGTVDVSPLWLSLGPSELNVGAGLSAAATGTITYPPTGGSSLDYDVCVGGNYVASVSLGSFSTSYSGAWLGPFNILGDGSLCPLGSIAGTIPPPTKPTVTAVSPNSGPITGGTSIDITGTGFGSDSTVAVGQGTGKTRLSATDVVVVSPTEITANTGGSAKRGLWNLFVTSGGATSAVSAGDHFTYYGRATVTGLSANSGPVAGGTAITITGKGFVAGASVVIGQGHGTGTGAIAATDVVVVSSTQITVVTGGGAKTGTWVLWVINPGEPGAGGSATKFTYQ